MPTSAAGTRQRVAVIMNPTKKTDVDIRALVGRICRDQDWEEPLWLETTKEDPGRGMAREAIGAGVDLVIAAGGDGTVRCVAAELAGTDTPLGLLPLGTGNLLARNLDIAVDDPEAAVTAALTGADRRIDVVHVTLDRALEGDVFLVMAGLGYDAALMGDTNDTLKDRVGWLAYVDAGIRNLPGKPVKSTIRLDGGKEISGHPRSVMGGNCGKIMGGLEIFPGARIDDGLLDIMTMAPGGGSVGSVSWQGCCGAAREAPRWTISSARKPRSSPRFRRNSRLTAITWARHPTWHSGWTPVPFGSGCPMGRKTRRS
ncbi:diacylglycerol/lipid kinase family protein [Arthrobacter citreus]|uniref:diacylglycerol/lipid kinase family protein n=1 Tax=Arthrobacter citreus TaxID=1670 RepID=UPI0031F85902